MQKRFEIFQHPAKGLVAVRRGFSWPAFFLTWLWALSKRLWWPAALLFIFQAAGVALLLNVPDYQWASAAIVLGVSIVAGINGTSWWTKELEEEGGAYRATVSASTPGAAANKANQAGKTIPQEWKFREPRRTLYDLMPGGFQGITAVAMLTLKAAVRFRFVVLLSVVLLTLVALLPLMIKDDGTAQGFTQIVLTYTLSLTTVLLGLANLWLACGTLARDVEEAQMQVVAVKPIPRWQIWLGKLSGILMLNVILLGLAAGAVFFSMLWRAQTLPEAQREALRNEVLIARTSAQEPPPDYEEDVEAELRARLEANPDTAADLGFVRSQIREQIKTRLQLVPPGYRRTWEIDLGITPEQLDGRPLFLRLKFNAAEPTPSGTYLGLISIGDFDSPDSYPLEAMSLAPDTFHEIPVPSHLIGPDQTLTVNFINRNETALLFPLEEGLEILYYAGGFGSNYARGVAIIFFWLALLAAMGLSMASFLSFPVAAFVSLALLTVGMSSGLISTILYQGTVLDVNHETGVADAPAWIDYIALPVLRALLALISLVRDFSPIDALSTGRTITWGTLLKAFLQICVLLGGIFSLIGMSIFTRRELATAQGKE